jgi:hypothetical protein
MLIRFLSLPYECARLGGIGGHSLYYVHRDCSGALYRSRRYYYCLNVFVVKKMILSVAEYMRDVIPVQKASKWNLGVVRTNAT